MVVLCVCVWGGGVHRTSITAATVVAQRCSPYGPTSLYPFAFLIRKFN